MSKFDEALRNLAGESWRAGNLVGHGNEPFKMMQDVPGIAAAEFAVRAIHEEDEALIKELAGMLTAVWYSLPKSFRDEPKIDAVLLKVANRNKPQGGVETL